jgi:hypothetical protein
MNSTRPRLRALVPVATLFLLIGCGSAAGSGAPSAGPAGTPAAASSVAASDDQTQPGEAVPSENAGGPDASSDGGGGPIGGDLGDRSKGSIQAHITGGLTADVDLPFAPSLAQLLVNGPNTAYLPFTDVTNGTIFLTLADSGLLVQYAGPDQVGLTNGGTPCELHLDSLDKGGAEGTFTCKGMLLVKNDGMGSADMTATFEGHP